MPLLLYGSYCFRFGTHAWYGFSASEVNEFQTEMAMQSAQARSNHLVSLSYRYLRIHRFGLMELIISACTNGMGSGA